MLLNQICCFFNYLCIWLAIQFFHYSISYFVWIIILINRYFNYLCFQFKLNIHYCLINNLQIFIFRWLILYFYTFNYWLFIWFGNICLQNWYWLHLQWYITWSWFRLLSWMGWKSWSIILVHEMNSLNCALRCIHPTLNSIWSSLRCFW